MTEMLKQEEYHIQKEHEKCHQVGRRDSALGASSRIPEPVPGIHGQPGHSARQVEAPTAYFSLRVYKPVLLTLCQLDHYQWKKKMFKGDSIIDFRKYLRCHWFKKNFFTSHMSLGTNIFFI